MRPYILAESNWGRLKTERFDLAILPWGATEAHNYHLPYGTDIMEAEHVAAESARIAHEQGAKVVVLPTIPFGVNTGQADVYLDINMSPSTQMAVLSDIIQVLNRQGLTKLLVLNSHGGNNFKPILRELGLNYPKMFLSFCNWFQVLDRARYFENNGDHAEEMETSVILEIAPHLVAPREEWGDGRARQWKIDAFREGWAWAERQWTQVTDDTGIGDPSLATSQKGSTFLKDVTEKIASLMIDLANADQNALYE